MRFCYLRVALLTSAFAAKAVTDTAGTASRTASSPTFVRDDLAASAVTETPNVDGEDRGRMPIPRFAKLLGKAPRNKDVRGLQKHVFYFYMDKGKTPKEVYDDLGLSKLKHKFMSDVRWIKWVYLLCQLSRHFEEDIYEFIIAAMSVMEDAEALPNILLSAVKDKKTKPFAIDLIKVADEQTKSRVLKILPSLESELSQEGQHSADTIYKTPRDRIDAYLMEHVTSKKLGKREFSILTSYLSILFSKDLAVSTGQHVARKWSEDAALLKLILSLDNFDDQNCVGSLVAIYLDVNLPPSKIVSMLVEDVSKADHFDHLISRNPSRRFWLNYLAMYSERNHGNELSQVAISDFEHLLKTLDDVAMKMNDPARAFSDSAISTWLKVLTLPHLAHLQKSQQYRERLMSIWLERGKFPSRIVSALKFDEVRDNCFTILFLNKWSRSFWVRYFEQYVQTYSNNVESMQSANADFEKLVKMLFEVATQKESHAAENYVAYSTILKMLLSPSSTHLSSNHDHVIELMSNFLLDRTLPSNVVSMLTHGEAAADKFNILFVNKSSKSFWVRYLKMYFQFSFDVEDFPSTANTDFRQLLTMVHAVEVQESATTDKSIVRNTILKILVTPEIATILDQKYLKKMVSIWLRQRIPPSDIVLMLVFEEVETDYFQLLFANTPSAKLWEVYTKAYHANTPSQQNYMMSTLIRAFGYANLERILKAALTVEATSEKAKALISELNHSKYKSSFSNDIS